VLAIGDGVVYAGGDFTVVNGFARPRLAAFSQTGVGALTPWNPVVHDNQVLALAVVGNTVYVGGSFTQINEPAITRPRLAAFEANGVGNGFGDRRPWNPGIHTGQVNALAVLGDTVFVGGSFTSVSSPAVARNRLASFQAHGVGNGLGNLTGWDPNANGAVLTLATSGSTVYAGGAFTFVRGTIARAGLAAFPSTGAGIPTPWNPQLELNPPTPGPASAGVAFSLAPTGSTMYVGGLFRKVGGFSAPTIAAVSLASGAPLGWAPAADDLVTSIAVAQQGLVVGGQFTALGYPPLDTPFQPGEIAGATYRGAFGLVRALPDAPTALAVTPDDSSATVGFSPPAYTSGEAVTSYTLTVTPGPIVLPDFTAGGQVAGLSNGTQYTFSLTATTSAGTGPAATTTATPRTVPGAPTGVTAVPAESQATVSFTPPAFNGGAPITGYTVTASPGGRTASGTQSPIVVTGLTNDQEYTFTVTATNEAGVGPPSAASDPVTPVEPGRPHPSAPVFPGPRPAVPEPPPPGPRPPAP
jgi:hypothetical protein